MLGFKLLAGALSSCAFIGVAIGVGLVFASLVYSIARNPGTMNKPLELKPWLTDVLMQPINPWICNV